jgi:uncharacterized protein (TIGR02246 family)
MNSILTIVLLAMANWVMGQQNADEKAIYYLIDQYSLARENQDTVLLKNILTEDVDQLVSSGEWRVGIKVAVQGMLRSSQSNAGERKLTIDKIRFLDKQNAIVDSKYEIQNADGTQRKMWSSFIVVKRKNQWKISAIRNMLPAR